MTAPTTAQHAGENVAGLIAQTVATRPDAVALIDRRRGVDRFTTYAALDQDARRIAALLRAHGVGRGDGVLVFQPPTAELYAALLAMFRLGAVAMVVEPSAGHRLLAVACDMFPPRALLATPRAHLLRLIAPAVRRIPLKLSTGTWLPGAVALSAARAHAPLDVVEPVDADAPALITFTSGSTGRPKAAVRTHGILRQQHAALAPITARPGDVELVSLPIVVLVNLASGATSVLPDVDLRRPADIDAARVLEQIAGARATRVTASPAFLERLVDAADTDGLAGVRVVVTGGGPVFPDMIHRVKRAVPGVSVIAVYGSTEAEPIAHVSDAELSPEDVAAMRAGAGLLAGPPVTHVALRVIEDHGQAPIAPLDQAGLDRLTLPAGRSGEIIVAGAHVVTGYLHGIGDEETKLRVDGRVWHRTGDAGYLDPRGRLWLLGRASAAIRDARGVLYPFAAECAARELLATARRNGAGRIVAVVQHAARRVLIVQCPRAERTEMPKDRELLDALAWAHLDEVRVWERLPMDRRHNSKVDYPAVAGILGGL